ncbi:glycoside hydrolase family 172 protein [Paenibacillus sp.]|uniref:glycoside hydrolase family 172 protein n=1 Tax=Paenibacillus sp. TaxID=58172 RepID=UPI002D49D41C|nr:glycoside hydrolase family 172 protein [Paenibacillus sp.]HZG86593.1 glycoside hydrolase family 172 protein [Paenibacillus sp.]
MGYGLSGLSRKRTGKSRRVSSWDRSGRNKDNITVKSGETAVIADIEGPGVIRHIWSTIAVHEQYSFRKILIRVYWDDEEHPSIDSPIGDFFGVGHGVASHYVSLPLNMITTQGVVENKAAMNCFFEMPFARRARFEITNECDNDLILYFYIDYTEEPVPNDSFYFHAQWRRENPTAGTMDLHALKADHDAQTDPWFSENKVNAVANLDGKGNYVILDAVGEGHYVGCNLSIDHIDPIPGFVWPGEGDDMFFIDGEAWPPTLHGTGTEDYFCAAWGYPSGKYDGPYHGISLAAPLRGYGEAWRENNIIPFHDCSGKWTTYRFHIVDPIVFEKSLLFSIEHGHANCQSNDYSSVAYWYQREPHKQFPETLPVALRLPLSEKESARRFYRNL